MAGKGKSSQRVEPVFQDSAEPEDSGLVAGERVAGNGTARGKATAKSPPRRNDARSDPRADTHEDSRSSSRDHDRPRNKGSRRKRGGGGGFLRSLIYWCVVLGIWGGIALGGLVLYFGARMPSASTWSIPERPANVKIVAMDGSLIANRGTTGGEALSLEEMSPYIPQALMAIEDRRFYSHFGVDPLGLARAMLTNLTSGRMVQGGSTLTQQLAKNLFLSPDRTLERKVQEVLLSFWLEQKFTKDQIMAMYLNRVFFGSNAYGVEAASRRYFNKSARDVNLGEAALLAGLLKAPTRLSPARDPQAAEERAQVVLGAMREEGYITDGEAATAMSQPPTKAKRFWSGAEHYAADMVLDEVRSLVGVVNEDIIVDSTLDRGLEKKADEALTHILTTEGKKLDASQAALVSIDGTGAIRALVGGADYAESQFNRAVKAKRQPGSAFKPFVYAAAIEQGARPGSLRNDAPVKIGNWTPENYDQKYRGEVTLASALANSLNTIAAQLVMETGPDRVIKLAHRLGIESTMQSNASIALGTSEVSLVELTSAYAPFMNGGYKATPHIVRRITTTEGKVLYENKYDNPPRVLSEQVVATMNSMLVRVITEGTGKAARLGAWQAAGKSGTTQSFRDALFVGYTSNLTTGVWFGNDDGKSMKKVTGGGLPAKAWKEFMAAAHHGLSPAPLFGLGAGPVLPEEPVTTPPQDYPPQSIGDIISGTGAAAGGGGTAPAPGWPTGDNQGNQQLMPPADVVDNGGRRGPPEPWGGPVPPADVGGDPLPQSARRGSLLDVIMGN